MGKILPFRRRSRGRWTKASTYGATPLPPDPRKQITWRGFWLEEQIAEMVSVLARLREAPIDDRALVMAVADAGQCRARALTMDELLAAIQAQGVGHA